MNNWRLQSSQLFTQMAEFILTFQLYLISYAREKERKRSGKKTFLFLFPSLCKKLPNVPHHSRVRICCHHFSFASVIGTVWFALSLLLGLWLFGFSYIWHSGICTSSSEILLCHLEILDVRHRKKNNRALFKREKW